jgi:hypothetical protein
LGFFHGGADCSKRRTQRLYKRCVRRLRLLEGERSDSQTTVIRAS